MRWAVALDVCGDVVPGQDGVNQITATGIGVTHEPPVLFLSFRKGLGLRVHRDPEALLGTDVREPCAPYTMAKERAVISFDIKTPEMPNSQRPQVRKFQAPAEGSLRMAGFFVSW